MSRCAYFDHLKRIHSKKYIPASCPDSLPGGHTWDIFVVVVVVVVVVFVVFVVVVVVLLLLL